MAARGMTRRKGRIDGSFSYEEKRGEVKKWRPCLGPGEAEGLACYGKVFGFAGNRICTRCKEAQDRAENYVAPSGPGNNPQKSYGCWGEVSE